MRISNSTQTSANALRISNLPLDLPANSLASRLFLSLLDADINYCHWKSNNALDRIARGENDLDLLVDRTNQADFHAILSGLGFKLVRAPAEKRLPGILDYFGYDSYTDQWIHVHAHFQLVLGHDLSKNYHLPIEKAYLSLASRKGLIKVPAPDFEYVIFVVRMVLKHATWDVILGGEGKLKTAEQKELAFLQAHIQVQRVHTIINQYLPQLSTGFFDECVQAIKPNSSLWQRVKTGAQLQSRLAGAARRPLPASVVLKVTRRASLALSRRLWKTNSKFQFAGGGAIVAIVGGDGAGKSTAVESLVTWLGKNFATRSVHLGKPSWSLTTRLVRMVLKLGQLLRLYPAEAIYRETLQQKSLLSPGYPWLLRELCRARDRYHTYRRGRRYASNGGILIFDRFPAPQIQLMDGPLSRRFVSELADSPQASQHLRPHPDSPIVQALIQHTERYYQQFQPPELFIVLRLNPEIAVQRKPAEDPVAVHDRSSEVWALDWTQASAHLIDASLPKEDVLSQLKALIWSEL